ncbi:cytidylyltransferase domain-containing protein [Vreelandella populi]|uniref:Acylneuraminate cytidylyltransferase family protein n=1 Tax=Vreelandella populi TaxID=2498858 RepID=A0A433LBC9_9GAMM|nr:acylneuraminate cytidylyltransferase family protein [Halomonas populi]RUR46002.1 acylneuraminate cytidylyltransferase family protein [Halomonas populi]
MRHKVTCFLPCRAGSQRVLRKNIKPFAGFEYGLIQIKLQQLLTSELIDEVVLTTNDDDIIAYAKSVETDKIRIHKRVENLSSGATSTDQLVAHALELIPKGHILWTHVTSPFITRKHYDQIIRVYRDQLENGFDSLMTTTAIHGFLWQNGQPINYDRAVEKWPRTQTLEAIQEVNSGAFITSSDIYRSFDDRIGQRPYLYELDKLTSHDIDWPEDFIVAECMAEKGLVEL